MGRPSAPAENWGRLSRGHVNDHLVRWAQARGLEKGQRIRVDATAVQTNVHYPLDSELLYGHSSRHPVAGAAAGLGRDRLRRSTRRAKRRVLNIRNRRGKKRLDSYRDLIKWRPRRPTPSRRWPRRHSGAIPSVWPGRRNWPTILLHRHRADSTTGPFGRRRGTRRRSVPSSKSTPILSRRALGKRFSATVFVSTGASSLILDCVVERGNPADSNYVQPFLERHRQLYGKVPRQSAWDGGFASAANLRGGAGCGLFQKVWVDGREHCVPVGSTNSSNASGPNRGACLGPSSTPSGAPL